MILVGNGAEASLLAFAVLIMIVAAMHLYAEIMFVVRVLQMRSVEMVVAWLF